MKKLIHHDNFVFLSIHHVLTICELYYQKFHEMFCANCVLCDIHVALHMLILLHDDLARHFCIFFNVI